MKEAFEKIRKRMKEETEFLSDCTKYGNKDAEQQRKSYDTMMMYEISEMVEELIDIVYEVEAEYINKSTEHINKTSDCSSGWIPCSERLPDIGQRVLLWVYGTVCIGKRIDSKLLGKYDIFSLAKDVNESTKRIEAWMPLPESYKPEKGE